MRIKFWVFLLLVVVALTSWQWDTLVRIRREQEFYIEHKGSPHSEIGHVAQNDRLTALDPEATAVANGLYYDDRLEDLRDYLAYLVMEYPQNEFVLYTLIDANRHDEVLSADLNLLLVDRLIALRPDNALYHYLKADILSTARQGDNWSEFLDTLEQANGLSVFIDPYNLYKERVVAWSQQAGLSPQSQSLLAEDHRFWPFFYSIKSNMIRLLRRELTDGNTELADRIGDITHQIIMNQFFNGDRLMTNAHWQGGVSLENFYPQSLQLQYSVLPYEQAESKRWQLCAFQNASTTLIYDRSPIHDEPMLQLVV